MLRKTPMDPEGLGESGTMRTFDPLKDKKPLSETATLQEGQEPESSRHFQETPTSSFSFEVRTHCICTVQRVQVCAQVAAGHC